MNTENNCVPCPEVGLSWETFNELLVPKRIFMTTEEEFVPLKELLKMPAEKLADEAWNTRLYLYKACYRAIGQLPDESEEKYLRTSNVADQSHMIFNILREIEHYYCKAA